MEECGLDRLASDCDTLRAFVNTVMNSRIYTVFIKNKS